MKVLSAQSREKNQKRGQTLVEFALAIPIFLILIFGIFEFGRVILTYASVFTASREAARYGASIEDVGSIPRYKDCTGIEEAARRVGFFAELTDVRVFYDDHTDGFTDVGSLGNTDPVATLTGYSTLFTCEGTYEPKLGDQIVVIVTADYEDIVGIVPDFSMYNLVSRTLIKKVRWVTPVP